MKKIIISMMAVAALAACTKSEVQYEPAGEIGFAPVASNITKSVAGVTADGSYDQTFPTSLDLYVSANAQGEDADGNLTASWPDTYFANAKFIYGRLENNVYEGKEPRYWPNVKSLVFAGFSNACNIDDIAQNATVDFTANTISIEGYEQDNTLTAAGKNDLMWFPWDTKSYTKQSTAVTATMKHACSWITVKVIGDATTGNNYLLNNLTINGLYHEGDVVCDALKATWDLTGTTSAEELYSNTTGETFPLPTGIAQVFENVDNNMVVLPQTPTTIDVTYSYYAQEGADLITETVKNLSLKISDNADTNKWESGKHYIYTITITATEILVAPVVDEWVDTVVTPNINA